MKSTIRLFIIAMFCLPVLCPAQNTESYPLQEIAEDFSRSVPMVHALTGINVITTDGDTLACSNAHRRMVPASNMKLITTGTALLQFGPDYTYKTLIGYTGKIEDGTLKGDLHIIGGGDPTLGSMDRNAISLNVIFQKWYNAITAAGIRKIEGLVIGDGSWFKGMKEHPSWSWEDIGTYYGTGLSGLNFFENVLGFNVKPGTAPGSPISIVQTYPLTPWMNFIYDCSTGEAQTGDRLYLYTTDMSADAVLRGTLAVDRGVKTIECSNKFPEYTCAAYFRDWLIKKGIPCTLGAADMGPLFGQEELMTPGQVRIIGGSTSPTLARIITTTNYESNNLYAETLFRTLGKETGDEDSYAASVKSMENLLGDWGGMPMEEIHITDGSGLSRENLVSPAFLTSFLMTMKKSVHFRTFLASLPTPGSQGSMYYFMRNYPQELQERIRLKSGSMGGVRCYTGYILPTSDENPAIIFSIMANNFDAKQIAVQREIEKAIARIAEYN